MNPSYTYSATGSYVATLQITDASTSCSSSYSVVININCGLAAPSFTYSLGSNGLVNFTGIYTSTVSSTSYNWGFGNGQSSNVQNPTLTYPYDGSYLVYFGVTDSLHNCWSYSSDTVVITNSAVPCTPSVSFYMINEDSIAAGTWGIIPNYSSQVTGAMWYWGDGTSTPGLYPNHSYATAGNTLFVYVFGLLAEIRLIFVRTIVCSVWLILAVQIV